MRKSIDEMFPREISNLIKLDSNEMEARVQIDLIKLIEEGHILVVGVMDDKLLYQAANYEEAELVQA